MKKMLALLISGLSSVAMADGLVDQARACRVLSDTSARLRCYDALPLPAAAGATGAQAPASPVAKAPAAPAVSTAAPAAPAALSAVATATEQFGRQVPKNEVVDVIEASIPGPFEGWEPNTQWTLSNGQIWRIADGSRAFYRLVDPKVKIRRGALGGFFLEIEGENKSPKVRRVQ